MPRLDARIKTDLLAKFIYRGKGGQTEETVTIKELSLSGGLLSGSAHIPEQLFLLVLKLPLNGEVEVVAEPVRVKHGLVAVRFYYANKAAASLLWQYIRDFLHNDGCPYCGSKTESKGDSCPACGHCLNFDDDTYLKLHMKASFVERIQSRLDRLDGEMLQKVIGFLDAEMAEKVNQCHEDIFIGRSPHLQQVSTLIRKAANTDMNVLVLGESGTGKELTAKAIHERSVRKGKPFVTVNCAAIPEGLLEAELFGYERGAFTGAVTTKKGKFEIADGGSVFLDEIGDLPQLLQGKLLRFLEDRIVEKVGGHLSRKVDVRVIAATNCDLESMVRDGSFRIDLFFRLNSFTIKLPPLRERGEDKVILARYFLKRLSKSEGTTFREFSERSILAMRKYSWPGNVRELINKVRRGLVMATGEEIEPADMELDGNALFTVASSRPPTQDTQREIIIEALTQNNFIISHTARTLKISRPTLYAMIKRYGINLPSRKPSVLYLAD
ncbi:sigma-54 dependent transcriptional regulator [Geomonas sp. RF6]|uniref:sigma-54 interaction domain-containing protein n=1 Tax=Geomonas sp. RF6 TaxID=2897342 RepID=UPI001E5FAD13|nr:sigma-54 dependent transcriptional regulator [Geomonas sp. RF6]UFS72201.1 sigma-54 dependent transcriptional regulator [Geomonas sp. RF6]